MQLRSLVLAATAACAFGRLRVQKGARLNMAHNSSSSARLDINQKVYIENAPVLGDGAGEGALGVCTNFASAMVANQEAPKVKVCGTGIKATVYLRGDPPAHHEGTGCTSYYEYQWVVGKCDTGMAADTCDELSPAVDSRVGAAQSYIIEQC